MIKKATAALCTAAIFSSIIPMSSLAATAKVTKHYVTADLGAAVDFNRVKINSAKSSVLDDFTVELSNNGTEWTPVENNSTKNDTVSKFTFADTSNGCYSYLNYNARYIRLVSEENLDDVTLEVYKSNDIAPDGSSMLFETNDGTSIKASSTENIDLRLNKKNINTSAYIYWGKSSDSEYDFDSANIILPLDGEKSVSSFEIGSFFNNNSGSFTNYFPSNYTLSYINSSSNEVHANTEGWATITSDSAQSGRLTADFDAVTATHIKLTLFGGNVKGRNQSALGNESGTKTERIATFLSYIGIYTAETTLVKNTTHGSYEVEEDVPDYQGTVDLVMFMGQSNMAGRGEAADSIVCPEGEGYEFRAISDPTKLYNATEPFGVNENNASSGVNEPGSKTGSMVSSLMKAYYDCTGVPIVGVSCSKGGSQIDFWQPGSAALNDAISRYKSAKKFLKNNGYVVRRQFMVWCQGESDADLGTPIAEYNQKTSAMAAAMINEGLEKCFMVRIGHKNGSTKYDEYITAQTELCKADENLVMASEKFADFESLMKDLYHYHQQAYNLTGTDAGENIAAYYGDQKKSELTTTMKVISKLKTDSEVGVTIDSGFEGTVIAGLYNNDGTLAECKSLTPSTSAQTVKFSLKNGNAKSIRLFNWDSSYKPLGKSISIAIDSIKIPESATTDDFLYGSYSNSELYEHALPYRYYLPVNYDSEKEYPILMYLHGAGRRGTDNSNQLNNPKPLFDRLLNAENINKYQCIIVAPQCPSGEQWVDTPWGNGSYSIDNVPVSDELSMAKDIILEFENKFNVDTNRVYIAGQSMGGYGTWDMIMRNPNMFAAAIPQCAAGDPSIAGKLKTMAIWAHHGEADTTVPLSGSREMVDAIKKAGSTNIRYTQYPNIGHEVQVETFKDEDLLEWLFSKSLDTNASVNDNYTYLRINDVIIRNSDPRPIIKDSSVYVCAKSVANTLGWSLSETGISNINTALTFNDSNSLTQDGMVMVNLTALGETFGISTSFDDISNTASIKSSLQRAGALKIESVNANAEQAEGPAQAAIDGSLETRWAAATSSTMPENIITFDLGEEKTVSAVEIYFYAGDGRAYDFDIKTSTDGKTWATAGSYTSSQTRGFEKFNFNSTSARYVQYCGRGSTVISNNSKNIYNSFYEFEIYE